jgi:Uma2 family endonuclease
MDIGTVILDQRLTLADSRSAAIMSTVPVQKTKRIKLTRSSNGMMMTPEEFDAVTEYDDRFVYELIHGVLIVSPAPGVTERDPNGELEFLLRAHQYNHPQGGILDKTLSEQYVPLPDEKRREYQVIGVGEYWVIDRFARTMTVYKNEAGTSAVVVVKAEETYQNPLLPGFVLPLGRLLKVADEWVVGVTRPSEA